MRPAFLLIIVLLIMPPALAQHFDPNRPGYEPFHMLAGGYDFYVDTNTMQVDQQGSIRFNVIGYSPREKKEGGFSQYTNELNCRQGVYKPSFGRLAVSAAGRVTGNREGPAQTLTLRYDGGPLYNQLRSMCERFSGLTEAEFEWLDRLPR